LIYYHGGEAYTRRVGAKGLPQGSVLSPFLYNVGGSGIDVQMVRGVSLLQYADDLVIYASGFIVQRIHESLQKSLDAVSVFLSDLGLSISTTKSEVVLFLSRLVRFQKNSNT
jgi:Reverse transcriptase (RNA-dependent DNA polymerase)